MKIILKEDVYKLGSLGDEVEVKPGYARNYLIPQGKAVPFTRSSVKQVTHMKSLLAKQRADAIEKAQDLAAKLENTEIVFTMKAGESGKLFGSVTQKHIFDALHDQEVALDRKRLGLSVPIKTLGSHVIPIRLHTEVSAKLEIKVISDGETIKESETADEEGVVTDAVEVEETSPAAEEEKVEEPTE
jgi:large subunit ribosomal protein L9